MQAKFVYLSKHFWLFVLFTAYFEVNILFLFVVYCECFYFFFTVYICEYYVFSQFVNLYVFKYFYLRFYAYLFPHFISCCYAYFPSSYWAWALYTVNIMLRIKWWIIWRIAFGLESPSRYTFLASQQTLLSPPIDQYYSPHFSNQTILFSIQLLYNCSCFLALYELFQKNYDLSVILSSTVICFF
jgi:hypothetical protein